MSMFPWARYLTLNWSQCGGYHHWCMKVCVNGWMWGLNCKALYKKQSIYHLFRLSHLAISVHLGLVAYDNLRYEHILNWCTMPRDLCECIDMVNHFSELWSIPSPRLESKLCFIKASLRGSQDTQPTSCECTMNLRCCFLATFRKSPHRKWMVEWSSFRFWCKRTHLFLSDDWAPVRWLVRIWKGCHLWYLQDIYLHSYVCPILFKAPDEHSLTVCVCVRVCTLCVCVCMYERVCACMFLCLWYGVK